MKYIIYHNNFIISLFFGSNLELNFLYRTGKRRRESVETRRGKGEKGIGKREKRKWNINNKRNMNRMKLKPELDLGMYIIKHYGKRIWIWLKTAAAAADAKKLKNRKEWNQFIYSHVSRPISHFVLGHKF